VNEAELHSCRILVVDDQVSNVRLLERVLRRDGFTEIVGITDPVEAIAVFSSYAPDIVLLDLQMPVMDGFQVMRRLMEGLPPAHYLPIVVITADLTEEAKQRALSEGARDFLTKPFDFTEAVLRIRNQLQTRLLYLRLQEQNRTLEERVRERTAEIEQAQQEILERLARAGEYRDDDTGHHTRRVGDSSAAIARELGLPEREIELLRRASHLHDVGKIGIPDTVLLKPGRLTAEEVALMRRHTGIGAELLSGGRSELVKLAETIVRTHHERWDGGGYHGLSGEEIPLPGRIVAVADVFDALTHARTYKPAWSVAEAVDELRAQRGRQFDPAVVDAFLRALESGALIPQVDPPGRGGEEVAAT
jgi:putative two-component system response regulator